MILPLLSPALAALLLAGGAATSDVSFEQTTLTLPGAAGEATGVSSRVYCAGRRMRLEAGSDAPGAGVAFVLRLDEERAFRLDPAKKHALLLDANALRSRAQMDLSLAGDLMGADRGRTAPLQGVRRLAGYDCQGYRITAGSTIMDVWLTRALPVGIDAFADLLEWTGASQSLPGLMGELRALQGFPLETSSRVTVLGEIHETRTTVTKVSVGSLPARLFEIPEGWGVETEKAAAAPPGP